MGLRAEKLKQVVKMDGNLENFDKRKLQQSIWMAAQKVGGKDESLSELLSREVLDEIQKKYPNGEKIKTSEIGELAEKILIEHGHTKTAKEFIRFRENKKHLRQEKDSLGIKDELGLSYNTLYILKERYLKKNEKGKTIETPSQLIERVAKFIAGSEKGEALQRKWYQNFYQIMSNFEFLPGTRTLANAGKKDAQLANCFVWPMGDDIEDIFSILYKSTLIKKYGGGCGYNFSKIRPEGDLVGGVVGLAAGPVKMIEMFDLMTSLFRQQGKYESGNMAILNADHPDIFNFISAKQNDGYLAKTNISVGITDEFMRCAIKGKNWNLINPRTKNKVSTVKAKSILELMATMAWQTGDPGIVNLSAINRGTALANPLLKRCGMIEATNPCGEEPLYPYESCNLGYLNLVKFVKSDSKSKLIPAEFSFTKLRKVVAIATRFMDNVIDASWFPVDEVAQSVRNHRRIGMGVVGWAEALAMLEIPYDSDDAFQLAEKVAKTIYESAFDSSCEIAREKGPFPFAKYSIWANKRKKPRNVALMTFPPSSGNAVICETSFGIEPYFALAYEQNVLDGMRLRTIIPFFVKKLKERGLYSEEIIKKVIENRGSIQNIREIPFDIRSTFKVAHDIHWKDHIRMQAAFQKWTDNAITKTINMPASATPNDIEEAYVMAWKLGCKGLTVYRDNAKSNQVFKFGSSQNESESSLRRCPSCDVDLKKEGKCYKCKSCGFSTCEL